MGAYSDNQEWRRMAHHVSSADVANSSWLFTPPAFPERRKRAAMRRLDGAEGVSAMGEA